ncbi:ABC transporter permease [Paraburkholderia sp. ZP32-5]|uniref:ABC transporter permease n=1 Tax=Paraburkholderia sp. ZP32-5 TaxID=2883245 RepID=UPI001F383503|nr:ABC transporter permease [Paraburkholderia sp. ZP32-5]
MSTAPDRRARTGLRRIYEHNERLIIGAGSVITFLIVWEAAYRFAWVNPTFISAPSQVFLAGIKTFASADFHTDVQTSALEFIIGYVMAIGIGVPLGLLTGSSKRISYLVSPFIHILNIVPRITLLPVIIIWFGIGIWSKVLVVFLGALIPILISTYAGVKTSEERFMKVARSFNASPSRTFITIVLPGTVPFIFTGMKYGTGRALLGVIVGELYAATAGIGYFIAAAGNSLETDKMLVGVTVVVAVGLIALEILNRVEKRFDRWRPVVESEN